MNHFEKTKYHILEFLVVFLLYNMHRSTILARGCKIRLLLIDLENITSRN